jgi:hypothetical protein
MRHSLVMGLDIPLLVISKETHHEKQ